MKYVDSLVSSGFTYNKNSKSFIEARVAVSDSEYDLIHKVFYQIIKNYGFLNIEQQQDLKRVKKLMPRFFKDWRHKEIEKEAKNLLLKEAFRLNATGFEDFFPNLKIFLKKLTIQSIFEQLYIALTYSKIIYNIYKLDFVTRIYLEKMSIVFDLLSPFLTQEQITKWQQNIAPKLKRF